MRIVSLLPAATEICFALGLGSSVVGVSHECDHPPEVRGLPAVTAPVLPVGGDSRSISAQVAEALASDTPLYRVDLARLRELAPDLVLTQATCGVCAVPEAEVRAVVATLPRPCEVVSLSPRTLGDVLGDIRRVGQVAGAADAGEALVSELEALASRLRSAVSSMRRPRVCLLEWLDPPMVAGHWSPELLALAGADPLLGRAGEPTRATSFEAIVAVQPEVLLVAPCGYRVAQTLAEMPALAARPGFADLPAVRQGRVLVMDGNAYFNRPGPRLWEGAALLASALHPELVSRPAGASASALVRWG